MYYDIIACSLLTVRLSGPFTRSCRVAGSARGSRCCNACNKTYRDTNPLPMYHRWPSWLDATYGIFTVPAQHLHKYSLRHAFMSNEKKSPMGVWQHHLSDMIVSLYGEGRQWRFDARHIHPQHHLRREMHHARLWIVETIHSSEAAYSYVACERTFGRTSSARATENDEQATIRT